MEEQVKEAVAEGAESKKPSLWMSRLRSAGALVAFAAIGLALVLALGPVFEPKNNTASAGMINASSNAFTGEAPNTIDAVFIGDSETYTSLSPMEMWKTNGLATYNCSTSGQALPYCSTFLDRVLKTQRPKVVLLEANALFRRFSYEKVVGRAVNDAFPALEHHDRWKQLTWEDFVIDPQNTWTDSLKGFKLRFTHKPTTEETIAKGKKANGDKTDVPTRNLNILLSMKERCEAAGATLVVVSTPTQVNWNEQRRATMLQISEKYGIPLIDMNLGDNPVAIDWSCESYDGGDHVNYAGAVKASAAMADILVNQYGLEDHRGDAAYDSFANALPEYQELVNKKKPTSLD